MKDRDVHQLIEQQNAEKKAAMYSEFEKKHNLTANNTVEVRHKHTIRYVSFASVLAALCLIIMLPFMLHTEESLPADGEQPAPTVRFCAAEDCTLIYMDNTVKEYAANRGLSLLYLDWYDVAEDIQSRLYVDKNDNTDVIYIQEGLVNGETGEIVYLYIMDVFTTVDMFTFFEETCSRIAVIGEITVNWSYRQSTSAAFFEYEGYKYYISLELPMEEEDILRIAEAMISK